MSRQDKDTTKDEKSIKSGSFFDDADQGESTQAMDAKDVTAEEPGTDKSATDDATQKISTDSDTVGKTDSDRIAAGNDAADDEKTQVVAAGSDGDDESEATKVQPVPEDPEAERRRETERRRAEREAALGKRRRRNDKADAQTAPTAPPRPPRTTDKAFGSLGLFVLRLVIAGVMALHGVAKVLDIQGTIGMVEGTLLGQMTGQGVILGYALAIGELLIAVALLFGLATRFAGVGLMAITIMALVFVHWTGNPFNGYELDGEVPLILAGVGFLFLCVGAGGWSADRALRRNRAQRKEDKVNKASSVA
ncbi:DoxX family protein [Propioniferax innocua]|uniref:Putative oxidoreductase n=1 Tax=Propioniferax innocua TaxID=1753 RepID=A0A542ZCX1_9ACTN|nr:DoxX family protein [Propioniferax innocua]TQL58168.1 putative oxidoreductase [Propioniferax innocua]